MRVLPAAILPGLILSLWAAQALADPCQAIPDRGPMPAYLTPGKAFSGPVAYIGDGDSLCVAVGATADNWVEVRVADFYAPELNAPGGRQARAALSRIVAGRRSVSPGDVHMTGLWLCAGSTGAALATSCGRQGWRRAATGGVRIPSLSKTRLFQPAMLNVPPLFAERLWAASTWIADLCTPGRTSAARWGRCRRQAGASSPSARNAN